MRVASSQTAPPAVLPNLVPSLLVMSGKVQPQAVVSWPSFFADEIGAGGEVAPLVGAADLEFAAEGLAEVQEVIGLQELVAELGIADAGVAFHAGLHGVLCEHDVEGKIFSDFAEEIEEAEGGDPVGVVDQAGRIGGGGEVEEAGELGLDAGDVVGELFAVRRSCARRSDRRGRRPCRWRRRRAR